MGAAAFVTPLFVLLSAGAAHADTLFTLTESEARAGSPVHFSISGGEGRISYDLEVGDREVAAGSSADGNVAGQFTMPDLGAGSRTVTVEAQIEDSEDETTVTRKLQYLVSMPAAPTAVESQPAAGAAAPRPAAARPPEPADGPKAGKTPVTREPGRKRRGKRPARNAPERRTGVVRHRASDRDRSRRNVSRSKKRAHARRKAPRTAPLFDGVPESPQAAGSESPTGGRTGFLGLNAIVPPTAALSAPITPSGGGGGPAAAIVVPALLGLATLLLAGTVLLRNRRLAAAAGKLDDARLGAFARVARSGSELQRGIARRASRRPRDGD